MTTDTKDIVSLKLAQIEAKLNKVCSLLDGILKRGSKTAKPKK